MMIIDNCAYDTACGDSNPTGPRTQIMGLKGPNTINIIVKKPTIWVLGPKP